MKKPYIVGIAGGSGSGKTTLTKNILSRIGKDISVIYHDDYYKNYPDLSFEERASLNYDHPDAFETALLLKHLRKLGEGKAIYCPTYDYETHLRSKEKKRITPTGIILVEGILVLESKELCELMDLKIFVDTDDDIRLLRRIKRDIRKRNRSLESVMSQYLATVKPMYEKYVKPSREKADIVIRGGGKNPTAIELICERLSRFTEG